MTNEKLVWTMLVALQTKRHGLYDATVMADDEMDAFKRAVNGYVAKGFNYIESSNFQILKEFLEESNEQR